MSDQFLDVIRSTASGRSLLEEFDRSRAEDTRFKGRNYCPITCMHMDPIKDCGHQSFCHAGQIPSCSHIEDGHVVVGEKNDSDRYLEHGRDPYDC